MSRSHARLGPSSASRWMLCPGSVQRCYGKPDTASIEAAEGTFAHQIAEDCLALHLDPQDFIGHRFFVEGYDFTCTKEMADYLQPGIDRIRELVGNGRFYNEQTVDTSRWCGAGNFGTLDRGIIRDDLIVVGDLKYGSGVPVYVLNNEQIRIYALAFWDQIARHLTKAKKFLLIIDQPRIPSAGGEWEVTLDELMAFGEEVAAAAKLTLAKDAPIVPGEKQCRFCPVKAGCAEHERWLLDMVQMKFEDCDTEESPALPGQVTPERRSYLIRHAGMFRDWLDRLHAEALADALAGRPTPGLKAVRGRRPARAWSDAKMIESLLEVRGVPHDVRYSYSLISPTQAEKQLAPDLWGELNTDAFVNRGEGKPVLVPEEAKGKAITPATDQFQDVGE
jgi:hypothetical protein